MGFLVLIGLVWIGRWIFEQQFQFNPALTTGAPTERAEPSDPPYPTPVASFMTNFLPEKLTPLSASETYSSDTLSDKIDGRAELYLSAGVVKLECQRFAYRNNPASWMEVFLYDMGGPRNAFAVYGIQRREDSQDIPVADFAYKTPNAIFFAHGRYYVEIVASAASEIHSADMERFAKRFCENTQSERQSIPEVALFPSEGLNTDSIILYLKDGFGFEQFDNFFVAGYKIGGAQVTAFLTVRETDADAAELVKAYARFLIANGGAEEQTAGADSRARLFNMFGTYELVFARGRTLAGIHEAENKGVAEKLGALLCDHLGDTKSHE
jgi:hypothetical protein